MGENQITVELLNKFCANEEYRYSLRDPFSQGEYSYATDGVLLLRVGRIEEVKPRDDAPQGLVNTLPWDHEQINNWIDLPEYEISESEKCWSCKGTGKSSKCTKCGGEGEWHGEDVCGFCNGEGHMPSSEDGCESCYDTGVDMRTPIHIGINKIAMLYLERIKELSGIKISDANKINEPFRIKFDGGYGLIMPMRSE